MKTRRRSLLCFVVIALLLVTAGGLWLRAQQRQYSLNRQLIVALIHNDTKQALVLINAGADPNTREIPTPAPSFTRLLNQWRHHTTPPANDSPTALMLVCGTEWHPTHGESYFAIHPQENLPLLQAMLAHSANVHAHAFGTFTALHSAASASRWRSAQILLQHGADVNAQDSNGSTALMYAASNGSIDMARVLLAHDARPSMQNHGGYTALHSAVSYFGKAAILQALLDSGADPTTKDRNGNTPLQFAQKHQRPDLVALLRKNMLTEETCRAIP